MIRPRSLLLGLALTLTLASPADAQRRGGGGGADGGGGKSGRIFGGAKVRLAPVHAPETVNIDAVMRKVKDLQVMARARAQQGTARLVELADEAQLGAWFVTCDHNMNGWISFSESEYSLRFTRGRFLLFDEDRDGRMVAEEFEDYYMHSVVSSGSFSAPRAQRSSGSPPERTPEQVRAAYDTDLDGALTDLELSQLLLDYEHAAADPDTLLDALDANGDRGLTLDELLGLHELLYPDDLGDAEAAEDAPQSAVELFGEVVLRPSESDAPPSPPLIIGPVHQFHRLDIDRDGFISVSDLETLMRPVRLGVRPHAVLNTLDKDGDLRLSRAEFLRAMGVVRR